MRPVLVPLLRMAVRLALCEDHVPILRDWAAEEGGASPVREDADSPCPWSWACVASIALEGIACNRIHKV
jgi:hypothetical protein